MHTKYVLFLLTIPKQDQELSPFSCSGLSLPGRGHVLVRFSHTITGLRTLILFLQFLDLLWTSLVAFTVCELLAELSVQLAVFRAHQAVCILNY